MTANSFNGLLKVGDIWRYRQKNNLYDPNIRIYQSVDTLLLFCGLPADTKDSWGRLHPLFCCISIPELSNYCTKEKLAQQLIKKRAINRSPFLWDIPYARFVRLIVYFTSFKFLESLVVIFPILIIIISLRISNILSFPGWVFPHPRSYYPIFSS